MCNFLSAIAFSDGSIKCLPHLTDSHDDLIKHFGLSSLEADEFSLRCARIEFSPRSNDYADLDSYQLICDEERRPSWFDSVESEILRNCEAIVRPMIIRDHRELLLGGCWILADDAVVDLAVNSRIIAMHGSSRIDMLSDSSRIGGLYGSSSIGELCDSSSIVALCGSSRVGAVRDSSSVGAICGSSRVGAVCDSSSIGSLYDSSRVGAVRDSSSIGALYGSSRVDALHDSSSIGVLYDSGRVDALYDSSRVVNDLRKAQ